MRVFDWLWPRKTITPSALAELLERGQHVVLGETQTLTDSAVAEYSEAQRIAESLREFPEDWAWRVKGYELQHVPTGFVMWVANKAYGLEEIISSGGRSGFSEHEQAVIWPAVEAWLARCKLGFTGRLPKVKIHCSKGVWWCFANGHPWAGAGNSPAEAYESWARAVSIQERKDKNPDKPLQVWSRAL
ncbi:hypothetical protein YA0016_26980 [Pseudomonas syringae]|uniref:hypothetical protein n=1 Tax=Pseudomonas syringae group TaxID=136849 RepID=UPI000CF613ED|nr:MULTISPECIES: hypothetical protein [Pseudomonas syringae group]AVI87305.1 hypothetical protein XJ28_28155 [Pseudomonas syringae pv. tomato]MBI6845358.1 hypothetical protein [Pseudomonas syringae]QBI60916.1 hypothetical protein EIZ61_05135 [Pseudomonas syringae]